MTSLIDRMGGRADGRVDGRAERGADARRADGSDRSHADGGTGRGPAPPTGARDRRGLLAVGSLVLVGLSIAAFAGLYASAGRRTAAVVVVHPLAQGQTIAAADLGQAEVSVSTGVHFIPAAEASVIRGRRAASAIPAGSLLTTDDLAGSSAVATGDGVVGLALKDGQFPASGLVAGGRVLVVETGTPGAPLSAQTSSVTGGTASGGTGGSGGSSSSSALAGSGTGVLVPSARVVSVSAPSTTSNAGAVLLVSVEVPSAIAPDVATAASAGQVSLVLLPPARGSAA